MYSNKQMDDAIKSLKSLEKTSMDILNTQISPELLAKMPPEVKQMHKEATRAFKLKDSKGKPVDPADKLNQLQGTYSDIINLMKNYGSTDNNGAV